MKGTTMIKYVLTVFLLASCSEVIGSPEPPLEEAHQEKKEYTRSEEIAWNRSVFCPEGCPEGSVCSRYGVSGGACFRFCEKNEDCDDGYEGCRSFSFSDSLSDINRRSRSNEPDDYLGPYGAEG